MNAVISDIANLKNDFLAQFLLNVEIPFLCIRRLEIVLNAGNIERWLRRTRAEDWHANAEGDRSAWHDRITSRRADWILREPLFEIVERNRIVVDSESGAERLSGVRG